MKTQIKKELEEVKEKFYELQNKIKKIELKFNNIFSLSMEEVSQLQTELLFKRHDLEKLQKQRQQLLLKLME